MNFSYSWLILNMHVIKVWIILNIDGRKSNDGVIRKKVIFILIYNLGMSNVENKGGGKGKLYFTGQKI